MKKYIFLLFVAVLIGGPQNTFAATCFENSPSYSTGQGQDFNGGPYFGGGYIHAYPFTLAVDCTITKATFLIHAEAGNPTDGMTVNIYDDSGQPNTILETGAAMDTTGLGGTFVDRSSDFAGTTVLTPGTYWVSINRIGNVGTYDNSNYVRVAGILGGSGHNTYFGPDFTTWTFDDTTDLYFKIEGTIPPPPPPPPPPPGCCDEFTPTGIFADIPDFMADDFTSVTGYSVNSGAGFTQQVAAMTWWDIAFSFMGKFSLLSAWWVLAVIVLFPIIVFKYFFL